MGDLMTANRSWRLAIVLLAGGAISSLAQAGGLLDCMSDREPHCPPSSYSRLHYVTPCLYRWYEIHHTPYPQYFAIDLHPNMAPTYRSFQYPCPPVNPALLTAERKSIVPN
jgi:hypothetical protein